MKQEYIIGFGMAVVLSAIGYYDWTMLLVLPIAFGNGLLNASAITNNKFGDIWHALQWWILATILAILTWVGVYKIDELLLTIALYFSVFEVTVNLSRKPRKPWNYVGFKAWSDKLTRWVVKGNEAYSRVLFIVIKLFLIAGGLYWWLGKYLN